jgi:hypothetical protein
MKRIEDVTFEFVDLLPGELADGIVYVSLEHRTVVHKCCSGCGERVVVNLSPAGWKLTFDGETISLSPSIGNGSLDCNSHYWIRENKVEWSSPLSAAETRRSQAADRSDAVRHYETPDTGGIWRRIRSRLSKR